MKRMIACILFVCILLSGTPVTALEREEIPFAVLQRAASYSHPHVEVTRLPSKRNINCFGIPAPLMDGQEILRGQKTPLRYILSSDGQRYISLNIYIYDCTIEELNDPKFDRDPIAYDAVQYAWEKEINEYSSWWDTSDLSLGTYSILSFTKDNKNQIDADTAAVFEIKVVNEAKPLTGLTITNEDSGKEVKAFYMQPYGSHLFSIGRTPYPTTDPNNLVLNAKSNILKEYHGMVIGEAEGLTHREATITAGNKVFTYEVHVCSNENGHRLRETQVRKATETLYGMNMIQCLDCGLSYTEAQDTLTILFSKFSDVPKTEWFYEEVRSAVLQGLFNGMSEDRFSPNVTMNRAMLVTALWRFAGCPESQNPLSFTDVPAGAWYADAVAWASGSGIVNGTGDERFSPNNNLTREQMATILYRYAQSIGTDTSARQELTGFPDGNTVSKYARDSISWAVAEGIIGGSSSGGQVYLLPQGDATRAQVAAVMVRTLRKISKTEHYEIALPECAVIEEGNVRLTHWSLYEDGTLVLEAMENNSTYASFDHLIDQITAIKILEGNTSTGDLKGNFPNLERVEMADSVKTVGEAAFTNCPKLTAVRFSPYLERIQYRAFMDCTALEAMELPESLQCLYGASFLNCTSLKEVRLPSGLMRSDRNYAISVSEIFKNCTALERVYLGVAMGSVPDGMFDGCTGLKEIIFADGVSTIGGESFANCTGLTELVLPKSICYMNDESFKDCTNLKSVTILNPYLYLSTYYDTGGTDGVPAHQAPFPEGCLIRGYEGSTAQEIALHFGYEFEIIDTP